MTNENDVERLHKDFCELLAGCSYIHPDNHKAIERFVGTWLQHSIAQSRLTAQTWRGISSAPKDGTKIMVFVPKGDAHICLAFWKSIEWKEERRFQDLSEKKKNLMFADGGYWSSHFKGEKPMRNVPTHWSPLPLPPESAE